MDGENTLSKKQIVASTLACSIAIVWMTIASSSLDAIEPGYAKTPAITVPADLQRDVHALFLADDLRTVEPKTTELLRIDRPRLVRPQPRIKRLSPIALTAGIEDQPLGQPLPASNQYVPGTISTTQVQDASNTRQPTVDEALETKGSVTFRKTPLSEVVFLLSDLWHVNIVAGENVTGEVSGSFRNAPLREVLSAALSASGYGYLRTGSSLIVLPRDQLGVDDPSFSSETLMIPPTLSNDDATIEAAKLLLSERGQLRAIGPSAVLIVDTPQRIDRVRQLFADLTPGMGAGNRDSVDTSLDNPGDDSTLTATAFAQNGIAYFSLQYTEAEQMRESLELALGENVVVAVFAEENRIMIKGSQADLRLATEAIEQLDKPRAQVRITAMIYDVTLKEAERLGINWGARPHSSSLALSDLNGTDLVFRNNIFGSTGLISDPAVAGAANLTIRTINEVLNVETLIQALDASSEAKLLANPSITVGNRRQATMKIVQKIPVLAADPVDNSGVVFSEVQFEEAGVILNVLPRISRDGTIEMQVKPEYSVVADFIDNNPVIDSREAETTVRVQDGHTFALGGLRQKTVVESVRGVVGLRNIKFIGRLFEAHDTEIRESELIVFLKPEVITPFWEGDLREQRAAEVSRQQLGEIPYAEPCSMLPCCRDRNCPNHHPRPRMNGGSRALGMDDSYGMIEQNEMLFLQNGVVTESVEIIDDESMPNRTYEQDYPPVIVDPRVERIR